LDDYWSKGITREVVGLKQITRDGEMSEGQPGTHQTQKKITVTKGAASQREEGSKGRSETLLTPTGAILKQSVPSEGGDG
jgi:hypothetical protein